MSSVISRIEHWLGWCPNHPAAQAARPKIGAGIILVAVIGLILLSAAVLLIPAQAPENVAVWAFKVDNRGVKHFAGRLPATEDTAGRLVFSPALDSGNYALLIEHPGADGSFRLVLDGANVKLQSSGSAADAMMLFTISGPGSLQQENAYQALLAAFDPGASSGTAGYLTEREYRAGS
jgi:hypothetical protein